MARNHLADIRAGRVDKGNIIGIRKVLSTAWRVERGYSNGVTAPKVGDNPATAQNTQRHYLDCIADNEPSASSALTATGLAILNNPRWRHRFTDHERAIIADLDVFKLVRFDDIRRGHFIPVWRAVARNGDSFLFRNIPWQAAIAYSRDCTLQSGPTIETE